MILPQHEFVRAHLDSWRRARVVTLLVALAGTEEEVATVVNSNTNLICLGQSTRFFLPELPWFRNSGFSETLGLPYFCSTGLQKFTFFRTGHFGHRIWISRVGFVLISVCSETTFFQGFERPPKIQFFRLTILTIKYGFPWSVLPQRVCINLRLL